jgi:hypothetical protein
MYYFSLYLISLDLHSYIKGTVPTVLTSASDGGEWLASPSCHFTPRETATSTYWIRGLSRKCKEENTFASARNQTLTIQPVACHYTNSVIPAYIGYKAG